MGILDKFYVTEMPDGSKWSVPVRVIAENRAAYYAKRENCSMQDSLIEDTIPLFEEDDFEIEDWAQNNMNWDDVKSIAMRIDKKPVDYQEGWVNGEHEIRD